MGLLDKVQPHKVRADILDYKLLIAGKEKAGKSSLAYNIIKEKFDGDLSKGLLLGFERGYLALDGVHAIDIGSWKELLAVKKELIETRDKNGYKVLIFDTVDLLEAYVTDYIIKREKIADSKNYKTIGDIPWGGGYAMIGDEVQKVLNELDQAGYSLWFITHSKDKTFTSKSGFEYDQTVVSLGNKIGAVIKNMVDFINFIDIDKEKDENGELVDVRKIYFRGSADVEAGSRFREVPDYILYDTKEYIKTIEDAIRAEYSSDKALEKAREEQSKLKAEKNNEAPEFTDEEEFDDVQEEATLSEQFVAVQNNLTEVGKKLPKNESDPKYNEGDMTVKDFGNILQDTFGTKNYKKIDVTEDNLKKLKDVLKSLQ